jgi:membrane fusion protein (multidrug efflux system)
MFEENVLESGESAPVEAESLQSLPLLPRELTRSRRDGARQEEASAATLFLEHAAPSQPSLPADRREGPPIDMRRQSRSLLRLRPVVSAAGAFLLASIIGAGYVYVDYIRHFERPMTPSLRRDNPRSPRRSPATSPPSPSTTMSTWPPAI